MPKTCLIVDDSKVIRKVARHMAESLDFVVEEAADGLAALSACARAMPDVILLDWNMPGLNGLDVLRAVRGDDAGRLPRIIFCTTENGAVQIRAALDSGADEYIMKPFDRETLLAKLALVGVD